MAPHLNINFDDVPDQVLPVQPGIYTAEITEEPEVQPTRDEKGQKVVVTMKITTDGPEQGRTVSDHISVKMQTKLKRLAKSAGLEPGSDGIDLAELNQQRVRVKIGNRTYKDNETGEQREATDVRDYLIPEDEGYEE